MGGQEFSTYVKRKNRPTKGGGTSVAKKSLDREAKWAECVAVDSESFVTATKEKLGSNVQGRKVLSVDGNYELREPASVLHCHFGP
mgnify:CR=1 FL=1